MTESDIKRILVIRFRRVGDSILAMSLIHTLHRNFPDAEIDFVLDENIAPLFEWQDGINDIITFNNEEKHSFFKYVAKVWNVTHRKHYDVIIDFRSTVQTLWFSLFSLNSKFRIGRRKGYNAILQNYRPEISWDIDMVRQNLLFLSPLEKIKPIIEYPDFSINVDSEKKSAYRKYMQRQGVDFNRPVIVAAVATRIPWKVWDKDRMKEVLHRIITCYDAQVIFNYGGKAEEDYAKTIRHEMGDDPNILIDVRANNLKELAELISNCDFFFGNEGGPRHLSQALGIHSFAIYPPNISKATWLHAEGSKYQGIEPADIDKTAASNPEISYQDKFALITVDEVWQRLKPMLDKSLKSRD